MVGHAAPGRAVADRPSTALTLRGRAASRLSEFHDVWAELIPADRAWFAEDLRDLLVDAVLPEIT